MSSSKFKKFSDKLLVFKSCLIYMYKEDLVLNNLQGLDIPLNTTNLT